jgi:hypothetical protein
MKKDMKVAVLNFSGNVGKTTISKHCLSPRMGDCKVFFVETVNEGGDETNIKGRDFKTVLIEMAVLDTAIVDIGSSNIEQVLVQLKGMADSHEDFDFYVIPTVPIAKQQQDTIKIILALLEIGVDQSKIKIAFNQVELDSDIKKVFSTLISVLEKFSLSFDAVIYLNDIYPLLGTLTINEVIGDGVDFKGNIAKATDAQEKREIATAQSMSRLAKAAKKNLDDVFDVMFKDC